MMNKNNVARDSCVIFVLFTLLFATYWIFADGMLTARNDIIAHAELAIGMLTGEIPIAGNFLLYILMMVGSFFSTNLVTVYTILCLLLAFATCVRYYLAQKEICLLNVYTDNENKNYWLSVLFAISLIFIFAIPIPSYFTRDLFYLGNFTPNLWHNSTTIFLLPFAILLYYYSSKQLSEYSSKRDLIIFILILLNIFIKPSFFFTVITVYPLMMLYVYRFSATFWKSMIPLMGGVLALVLVTWIIYNPENSDGSGIGICLLCVYERFGRLLELPFAFLFSMLFPLLYTVLNFKKLKHNLVFWYTISLLAIAMAIFFVLVETGPRLWHGNFYWQIVPCTWLFFFFSLKSLLIDIRNEGLLLKYKLLLCLYSLHVVAGILYLVRIFMTNKAF